MCSAHPTVVEAAIAQAAADGSYVLIEATSNQVDQFGGYTGLRPAGIPRSGPRHRRPTRIRARPRRARRRPPRPEPLATRIRQCGHGQGRGPHRRVRRGGLHQDPPGLQHVLRRRPGRPLRRGGRRARPPACCRWPRTPRTAAASTHRCTSSAPRCRCPAERTRRSTASPRHPPTAPDARSPRTAPPSPNWRCNDVWPRVIALVVQPGVEFDHLNVIDYEHSATAELRRVLDAEDHLVFEAHSTDYQRPAQLRELVEDHWAILKVGPALTFAMREALFALALIEAELVPRPVPIEPGRGRRTQDARRARALAGLLHRRRSARPAHVAPLQLQRPAPLLLGRRRGRRRPTDPAGQPRPHGHPAAVDQPVPAPPVQPDTCRRARARRAVSGHRPNPRRDAPLRPSRDLE